MDYLEEIFLLSRQSKNGVRITDIAKQLVVKKSSVVAMIEKGSYFSYPAEITEYAAVLTQKLRETWD